MAGSIGRDALKNQIAAAFAIKEDETRAMADAIMTAFTISMIAAYHASTRTIGLTNSQWAPSDAVTQSTQEWAAAQADAIAATYADELDAASESFLDEWVASSEPDDEDGAAAAAAAADILGTWALSRSDWKAAQIANVTCGSGDYAGIDAFLADFTGEGEEDTGEEDSAASGGFINPLTGLLILTSGFAIACMPDSSSNDVCADVAGQTFDIDQWAELPPMPAHPGCPHTYLIIGVA